MEFFSHSEPTKQNFGKEEKGGEICQGLGPVCVNVCVVTRRILRAPIKVRATCLLMNIQAC